VYFERMPATDDADVYRMTYAAKVPPDVAWEAISDITEWAIHASVVKEVKILSEMSEQGGGPRSEMRVKFTWRDGMEQEIVISRDSQQRLIDMTVLSESRSLGYLGHCAVKIDGFVDGGTLVTADIRIDNNLGRRLAGLFLFIGLAERDTRESGLKNLWRTLAERHRAACLEMMTEGLHPATGRTHIVAVGVDSFENEGDWKMLNYAEDDAKAFFDWAKRANPVMKGEEESLIRELLVGPAATSVRLGAALDQLVEPGGPVRNGDTILFFFAGHIGIEEDILDSRDVERYPYLITANAKAGNLRWSGVKRDDVLRAFQLSEASRCIFFCDACYSGGPRIQLNDEVPRTMLRGDRTRDHPYYTRGTTIPAREEAKIVILAAAQQFERAAERDDLQHGVFTHFLLAGVRGAADLNEDGYVTIGELSAYLQEQIPALTDQQQHPFISIDYRNQTTEIRWPVR